MTIGVRRGPGPLLPFLAACAVLGACAPAPLYTASGSGPVSVYGEIPRDARGEPVWHLIRPAPGGKPILTQEQVEQMARARTAEPSAEGSRLSDPK